MKESVFFYMGDFDPEGLLIAQRLKQRYAAGLELWNYRLSLCEAHRSDATLSPARLAKPDRVCLPQLQPIADAMRRSGKAAYQEAMAGEL